MHYWPELYTGAALFAENNYEPYFTKEHSPSKRDSSYGNSLPSDEALFCSIEQYADGEIAGNPPLCYSPLAVADWYYALAESTARAVSRLKKSPEYSSVPEVKSSAVDFAMLAGIARFHAWKVHAAYHLCRFTKTGDKNALALSYQAMGMARAAFAETAALGTKYYARNIEFDAGTSTKRNGNWQDRLEKEVDADVAKLGEMLKENGAARPEGRAMFASLQKPRPFEQSFTDNVPAVCKAGRPLQVRLKPSFLPGVSTDRPPVMFYRRANLRDGGFIAREMARCGESFAAEIPGDYITGEFSLYIYFACRDTAGNALMHPGVYNAGHTLPVHVVSTE
jgi:hypothetical protein